MSDSPCYECSSRKPPDCHTYCDAYKLFEFKCESKRKQRLMDSEYYTHVRDVYSKHRKKRHER